MTSYKKIVDKAERKKMHFLILAMKLELRLLQIARNPTPETAIEFQRLVQYAPVETKAHVMEALERR